MARSTEAAQLTLASCSAAPPPPPPLPGLPLADELDLVLEFHAEAVGHHPPDEVPERADIGGAAVAVGDDEVGVARADRRAADAATLQTGGINQSAGVVAGRGPEHAARGLGGERVGGDALRLGGGHP